MRQNEMDGSLEKLNISFNHLHAGVISADDRLKFQFFFKNLQNLNNFCHIWI